MPEENISKNEIVLSEEISNIISNKPHYFIRNGSFIVSLLIMSFFILSWFIQYPDIILSKGVLFSLNAPKELILNSSGKVVKHFILENKEVKKNDILCFMESTADHDEVLSLKSYLDSMKFLLNNNYLESPFILKSSSFNRLGELQFQYQKYVNNHSNFINYIEGGFYLEKIQYLNRDLENLKKYKSNLYDEKMLLEKDLTLSDSVFTAIEQLKKENVISFSEYSSEKSSHINKELVVKRINLSIISNDNAINQKLKEIAELNNQINAQKRLFLEEVFLLLNEIENWIKKYILSAPISGRINLITFIEENQYLESNRIIGFVNPNNASYYIESFIPQKNFGKVQLGQNVLLDFDAYPSNEYGKVLGRIQYISNISTDSGFLSKVLLPHGLITNLNKQIQFKNGLKAEMSIITSKRRLFDRFLNSLNIFSDNY